MDNMNRAPCLLCGAYASPSLHERKQEHLSFLVCEECGLTSLHPRPTPEALAEWYGSGEGSSHEEGVVSAHRKSALTSSRKIRETLQWCLKTSASQFANGTVLDVACGYGNYVAGFAELLPHSKIIRLEPEAGVVDTLRVMNRNPLVSIQQGTSDDFVGNAELDAIFLMTVFEHLPNPLEVLKRLYKMLVPSDFVYIGVPDLMDPGSIFGLDSHFHRAHMFYYTDRTLSAMLRKGFEPIAILRGSPYRWSTGSGLMIAAKRIDAPISATSFRILGEADRIKMRVAQVRNQTRFVGPLRWFYRYRVRRPLLRQRAKLAHFGRTTLFRGQRQLEQKDASSGGSGPQHQ